MTVYPMLTRPLAALCGAVLISLILGGCSYEGTRKLPGVYRIDIQQGNVVDQDMLDQLKPGMGMQQVRYIMGTPVIVDPFHQHRWEYIFSYSEGGKQREQRHITLYFDPETKKLERVGGDIEVTERTPDDITKEPSRTVEVPLRDDNEGFFGTIFGAIPFLGDDGPTPNKQPPPREPPEPPAVETDSLPDEPATP